MRLKAELNREVEKKTLEVRELEKQVRDIETQIRECNAYISGIQKAIKLLPPDLQDVKPPERVLRTGSDVAKARDYLRKARRPLHVVDILKGIGKENTKETRVSLSGSLAHYAKLNEIFVKTAPRTFGLLEFSIARLTRPTAEVEEDDDLPENFGLDEMISEDDEGEIVEDTDEVALDQNEIEYDESDPFKDE